VWVAACSNVPDPGEPAPPDDGESMQMIMPPEGTGGAPPNGDPSPASPRACVAGGPSFAHGAAVPSGDSCNSCLCYDGNVVCTSIDCAPTAGDAGTDAGSTSDAGTAPPKAPCEAAGQSFDDGSEVPSGDSCNICTCSDGTIGCTAIVCDPVFCAEFVEEPDGVCSRFPLDPCIGQDPDCGDAPAPMTSM